MKVSVLGSGSSGNCIYVENNDRGFLIDAGLSGRETEKRLSNIGKSVQSVDAIIITHDHSDHTKGAGILSRRHAIPIIIEKESYNAARNILGEVSDVEYFTPHSVFEINGLGIEAIRSDHDSASSVCLFIRNEKKNLGVFTDLGRINDSIKDIFPFLDAAVLEFNHDIDMLENGPYPQYLKERIRGRYGHLSNNDASAFVKRYMGKQLKTLFLAHLSDHNNTASIARETLYNTMKGYRKFDEVNVILTSRKAPTPLISL